MEKLAYLASLSVLATSIALAQNAGTANQSESNSSGNSSAETSQSHSKKAQPKSEGKSSDLTGADSSLPPATSPSAQAPVPTVTIHDRPSPAATTGPDKGQAEQPRIGSMGTTGNTPDTSAPQSTSPDQQPSSSTPDSPPPHTSLVGNPDVNGSSTEMLAAIPHRPPHAPDAGTQPNPQASELSETSLDESTAAPH